jgi:hypothetical protein
MESSIKENSGIFRHGQSINPGFPLFLAISHSSYVMPNLLPFLNSLLDSKETITQTTYAKWNIGSYGSPEAAASTSPDAGLSAVVGAMMCLALLIGVGGIIMIIILIK